MIPAKLDPSQVTALIDTREQTPLDLTPLQTSTATLTTGDYTIAGLEHFVAIERKSLNDLLGCVGRERSRFDREVQRLVAYPVRVLLVESTWGEIELGQWRGSLTSEQVQGALLGWVASGLQVELVGTHERAGRFANASRFPPSCFCLMCSHPMSQQIVFFDAHDRTSETCYTASFAGDNRAIAEKAVLHY